MVSTAIHNINTDMVVCVLLLIKLSTQCLLCSSPSVCISCLYESKLDTRSSHMRYRFQSSQYVHVCYGSNKHIIHPLLMHNVYKRGFINEEFHSDALQLLMCCRFMVLFLLTENHRVGKTV